jgi:DNA-binding NarL/FixJ family response regulator
MTESQVKVMLCDDHELVRRGLRALMESDPLITVVAEAGSADEAVRTAAAVAPDVVVMDVRMPGRSGIEACRDIRANLPDTKVLILTSFADDEALFSAIMAGAAGYVLKQVKGNDLLDAVHKVHRGQSLLDAAVTNRVLARVRSGSGPGAPDQLTPQETRLVELIAEGLTNRQIGDTMHLAEKTVKNYVSNVLLKLGLSRRTEVAAMVAKKRMQTDSESWS